MAEGGGQRVAASSRVPSVRFREIDASRAGLAALERFYRERYVAEFPDPDERESLDNMRRYLLLKAQGWYGSNNYHIVVAELDGEAVGGVVFDYLAMPRAGVIEFLFVASDRRASGIGRALLDEAIRLLRRDARRHDARLAAVVAEMNDPFRRPATPDNMDPFRRAAIWGRWGFGVLEFPYVQPALSAGQQPVDGLLLIMRPFGRVPQSGFRSHWVELVVAEYLRWAMRIEDPAADRDFLAMSDALASHPRVALVPLGRYAGQDPTDGLVVEVVSSPDRPPDGIATAAAIARAAIPVPGRVAAQQDFAAAFALGDSGAAHYHLWLLRTATDAPAEGMASFFTLPTAGFGGYLVLAGTLRGRGLLRRAVARIEARMRQDGTSAEGWFIECGAEAVAVFRHIGFIDVPCDYRPPAVGEASPGGAPERLHLLFKPFGMRREPDRLERDFVSRALREILCSVYAIGNPEAASCYRRVLRTLADGDLRGVRR
ncbi:GNAT family N-acetyltransferase [Azoarcus sp. CIB]|uniref:GNAT family N-acetyltransferase n=1 Tax=Aromatoleum sp. (strain CIB) TaxID=198107 RepID=UPI00067B0626|nr:GNAT family N-acetyltransferase [Azoarcus sp. CIB]